MMHEAIMSPAGGVDQDEVTIVPRKTRLALQGAALASRIELPARGAFVPPPGR